MEKQRLRREVALYRFQAAERQAAIKRAEEAEKVRKAEEERLRKAEEDRIRAMAQERLEAEKASQERLKREQESQPKPATPPVFSVPPTGDVFR